MRVLFLFVITMTVLPLTTIAEDICPDGTLGLNITFQPLFPNDYFAKYCLFSDSYFLSTVNVVASSNTTRYTVTDSTVSEGSLLGLTLARGGWAPRVSGPVIVFIGYNVFRQDAIFSFDGNLPANSSITFQNNQMSTSRLTSYLTTSALHLLYSAWGLLLSNSSLKIIDNAFSVSGNTGSGDGNEELLGDIMYFGSWNAEADSSIEVSRNVLNASNISKGHFIFIDSLGLSANASFNVESNEMTAINCIKPIGAFSAKIWNGEDSSCISFSKNQVDSIGIEGEANSSLLLLQIPTMINLRIDNNVIDFNHEHFVHGQTFSNPVHISITDNNLRPFAPRNSSAILIQELTFLPYAIMIVMKNRILLPTTVTNGPLLVQVQTATVDPLAKIYHCGNVLSWAQVATAEQLFSSELLSIVSELEVCPSETDSTTAPSSELLTTSQVTGNKTTDILTLTSEPSPQPSTGSGKAVWCVPLLTIFVFFVASI